MMASWRTSATSSGVISGSGLAIAKMIGLAAMDLTMSRVTASLTERPKNASAPASASASGRGAALIDDPFGVAQNDVVGGKSDGLEQLGAGDAGGAGAIADQLGRFDVAA